MPIFLNPMLIRSYSHGDRSGSLGGKGITFPMLLAAVGILASLIGTFFVRIKEKGDPQLALRKGTFATGILMIAGSLC